MTLIEAQRVALQILKDVMEEKINSVNLEIAVVETFQQENSDCYKKEEIQSIIDQLKRIDHNTRTKLQNQAKNN